MSSQRIIQNKPDPGPSDRPRDYPKQTWSWPNARPRDYLKQTWSWPQCQAEGLWKTNQAKGMSKTNLILAPVPGQGIIQNTPNPGPSTRPREYPKQTWYWPNARPRDYLKQTWSWPQCQAEGLWKTNQAKGMSKTNLILAPVPSQGLSKAHLILAPVPGQGNIQNKPDPGPSAKPRKYPKQTWSWPQYPILGRTTVISWLFWSNTAGFASWVTRLWSPAHDDDRTLEC